jgi:flagellar biosynthetic protein FliP
MNKKFIFAAVVLAVLLVLTAGPRLIYAAPGVGINVTTPENPQDTVDLLGILGLLTVMSLAPAIVVLMTCFTRIVIVLSFVRNAIGTPQLPPNQVIIGLAILLTVLIMQPVWATINQNALQPYIAGQLDGTQAWQAAQAPLREFMLSHTRTKDLALFAELKGGSAEVDKVDFTAVVPAFVISELKTAFQMGFVIFVPFLVIDMIVSSVLMSMGMMMLPPAMISLPFKILLFVLADGWNLVIGSLVKSFM